jgi:hypothetical protein
MSTRPIDPVSDPRIAHKTARFHGYTYHYLYAEPASGKYTNTVFLVRLYSIASLSRFTAGWTAKYADWGPVFTENV